MAKSFTKQFTPKVEKGIPLPTKVSTRSKEVNQRINWPFEKMVIGDSFLLPPYCTPERVHKAVAALKRRGVLGRELSAVVKKEGNTHRVWLTGPT